MKTRSIIWALAGWALLGVMGAGGTALAQCGHPANCTFPSHITVCPGGDIPVVGQVLDINGNPCIASTVHMQFHPPAVGQLWANPAYPFPLASSSTNLNGTVVFYPMVGGCAPGGFVTFFDNAGVVLGQAMTINSPDLNGDGAVNLSDVSIFASAFFVAYQPCSDFDMNGVINLSDLGIMAQHLGH